MKQLTHEQLNQKAQEVFEHNKNIETEQQNIEQLTPKEEEIKQNIKQIALQDNDSQSEEIVKDRKQIFDSGDERVQLNSLIKLCFTKGKGPNFAIRVAQGLSNRVLDSLHDVLVKDENYNKLKEKNII